METDCLAFVFVKSDIEIKTEESDCSSRNSEECRNGGTRPPHTWQSNHSKIFPTSNTWHFDTFCTSSPSLQVSQFWHVGSKRAAHWYYQSREASWLSVDWPHSSRAVQGERWWKDGESNKISVVVTFACGSSSNPGSLPKSQQEIWIRNWCGQS